MIMPFGFAPHRSEVLPSLLVSRFETNVQIPVSCSLSDFCWARPVVGSRASAHNRIVKARTSVLRHHMSFPPLKKEGARDGPSLSQQQEDASIESALHCRR